MAMRCIVNLQGTLSDHNLSLEAAKAGTLATLGRRVADRVGPRAVADARASGVAAVCVTVGHVLGPAEPWAHTLADLDRWDAFFSERADAFVRCNHPADVRAAQTAGRVGVVLGLQNSLMFGADPARVAQLAARGVCIMQLTYNDANPAGCGSQVQPDMGLSAFGAELLQAMAAARVLVDLSHASDATLRGALAAHPGPLLVSHTGCRALADHRRNVADAELRAVAQGGGVVGLYAMPFLRASGQPMLADWVAHIEHAWQVCGEDHVGIGTDGPLSAIDDVASYMRYLAEDIAERRRLGVSAAGEDPEVALFLPDCRGPRQFEQLAAALLARGHGPDRIDKLLGGNFLRLWAEVAGGQRPPPAGR